MIIPPIERILEHPDVLALVLVEGHPAVVSLHGWRPPIPPQSQCEREFSTRLDFILSVPGVVSCGKHRVQGLAGPRTGKSSQQEIRKSNRISRAGRGLFREFSVISQRSP